MAASAFSASSVARVSARLRLRVAFSASASASWSDTRLSDWLLSASLAFNRCTSCWLVFSCACRASNRASSVATWAVRSASWPCSLRASASASRDCAACAVRASLLVMAAWRASVRAWICSLALTSSPSALAFPCAAAAAIRPRMTSQQASTPMTRLAAPINTVRVWESIVNALGVWKSKNQVHIICQKPLRGSRLVASYQQAMR